ncbi:hypothetical protein NT2_12_01650 [Caenibius tardaugens NBRC 16725]|uniref:Uncharacterized protein n=1 Tax=Caenibius tardaugens NBRC 16725 TaxID=1219035 RepID=U2YBN0_9SPHN|nr:hypothetical protein NT2_12_01650 [Caenibius tardaugens NBRC 16725]
MSDYKSSGIRVKRAHIQKNSSSDSKGLLSAEECAARVVDNLSPTDMPGTLWDSFRDGEKVDGSGG